MDGIMFIWQVCSMEESTDDAQKPGDADWDEFIEPVGKFVDKHVV